MTGQLLLPSDLRPPTPFQIQPQNIFSRTESAKLRQTANKKCFKMLPLWKICVTTTWLPHLPGCRIPSGKNRKFGNFFTAPLITVVGMPLMSDFRKIFLEARDISGHTTALSRQGSLRESCSSAFRAGPKVRTFPVAYSRLAKSMKTIQPASKVKRSKVLQIAL